MIEVVITLMTNGFLQRTVHLASIASMEASFMAAAIPPVAPVMDEHHEAGDSTSPVFFCELMAVLVSDAGLREVSGKPVGIVEGLLEYLNICNYLTLHFRGECCNES